MSNGTLSLIYYITRKGDGYIAVSSVLWPCLLRCRKGLCSFLNRGVCKENLVGYGPSVFNYLKATQLTTRSGHIR